MAQPDSSQSLHKAQQQNLNKQQPARIAPNPEASKGDGASQALDQEQDAVRQMGDQAQLQINEGGRTNDSHEPNNPEGAVHGLPKPALKGTWR